LKTSQRPQVTSERPAYSPALYQIKSSIAKLLFQCHIKIWEGQAKETAMVAIGDDGRRAEVQE